MFDFVLNKLYLIYSQMQQNIWKCVYVCVCEYGVYVC